MSVIREPFVLGNGERISIQASKFHYCSPRVNDAEYYSSVEVGNIHNIELSEDWEAYHDNASEEWSASFAVYSFVPVELVWDMIQSKGGLIESSSTLLQLGK